MSSPDHTPGMYPDYSGPVPPAPLGPPPIPEQTPVAPYPTGSTPELPGAPGQPEPTQQDFTEGTFGPLPSGAAAGDQAVAEPMAPPEAAPEPAATGVIFDMRHLSPEARKRAETDLQGLIGAFLMRNSGVQVTTFDPDSPWAGPEQGTNEAAADSSPPAASHQPAAPEGPPVPNGIPLDAEQIQTSLGRLVSDVLPRNDSEDTREWQSDFGTALAERGMRTLRDTAILGLGTAKEVMEGLRPSRLSGKRRDFKAWADTTLAHIASSIPAEVTNVRLATDEVDPIQISTGTKSSHALTEDQLFVLEQPATMGEIVQFCQSAKQIPAMALEYLADFDVEMQPGWAGYDLVSFAAADLETLYTEAEEMLQKRIIEDYKILAEACIAEFREFRPSSVA